MGRDLSHIVPVLDAGQDANTERYFLIMPVCDCSLQDVIDRAESGIDIGMASKAVIAIIQGLIEEGDITHRDLKPANILQHEGKWKIADFGIAKFVEDSTSLDTIRDSFTPTYAAPEQWLGERPSPATDVYALGCIIHTLITGMPPFSGSIDDIRHDHLHSAPKLLEELSPRLAAFVSHMLRKPPNARPTHERCVTVLQDFAMEPGPISEAQSALAIASKEIAEKEAAEEAKRQSKQTIRLEREALFKDAEQELSRIKSRLFKCIKEQSESVNIKNRGVLTLGKAGLDFSKAESLDSPHISVANNGRAAYEDTGLDVLGWAEIAVACEIGTSSRAYTWSASFLYVDRKDDNGFRWYEVAFWRMGQDKRGETAPFSLKGYEADMYLAMGNGMHTVNLAYGPSPIDGEDEEAFIDRWIGLVAKAAIGELTAPRTLPINDFC